MTNRRNWILTHCCPPGCKSGRDSERKLPTRKQNRLIFGALLKLSQRLLQFLSAVLDYATPFKRTDHLNMPIKSAVDDDNGIFVHKVTGVLTHDEVIAAQRAFYTDGQLDQRTPVLWDAREIEMTSLVTFSEMARMAKGANEFADRMVGGRTAILTATAASFGMGRMYETLASSLPRQISVFREYEEAIGWLLENRAAPD